MIISVLTLLHYDLQVPQPNPWLALTRMSVTLATCPSEVPSRETTVIHTQNNVLGLTKGSSNWNVFPLDINSVANTLQGKAFRFECSCLIPLSLSRSACLCLCRSVLLCVCTHSVLRTQLPSFAQDPHELPAEEAAGDGERSRDLPTRCCHLI